MKRGWTDCSLKSYRIHARSLEGPAKIPPAAQATGEDGQGSWITINTNQDGTICVNGIGAEVPTEAERAAIWGCGFGFDLCKPYPEYDSEKVTLMDCPADLTSAIGIRATFSGATFPASELRGVFEEKNPGTGISYIVFTTPDAAQDYYMSDASVFWDANPQPMVQGNITGFQFQISTEVGRSIPLIPEN